MQLSSWLKTEAGKNRKQRRSLKQLHLDLKELGFEGSHDRVVAFARKWKVDQTDTVNSASKRTNQTKKVMATKPLAPKAIQLNSSHFAR
ncbi:hypothetical protein [Undibacterium sp. TJN19]|uniref:hypothetical protein n=1 Tax=Undibacterium sp. TJN19 TaxID=3413055 RepID=UPI003BF14B9A